MTGCANNPLDELVEGETAPGVPDLKSYDHLLVNSSAGKDSQTSLGYVYDLAEKLGVADRITVVHCDLGRVEWPGARELAEEQADRYGVRFEVVSRKLGTLLDEARVRRKWPGPSTRWCTAHHKRDQANKLITVLAGETRSEIQDAALRSVKSDRPRILNIMGMRADESVGRAKLSDFEHQKRTTSGRRWVDRWLPVHKMTTVEVWDDIRRRGVPHHRAYDLGMPRLSCRFCIFAGRDALLLAGHHNRELLEEYVAVEEEIGHTFLPDLSLKEILEAVDRGDMPEKVADWTM